MELATREGKRASRKAIEGLDLRRGERGGICLNDIDANEVAGRRIYVNIVPRKRRLSFDLVFHGNFVGRLKDRGHFML